MVRARWILCSLLLCACGARSGLDFVEREGGAPVAPDGSERCDGDDDDGDGTIDEGIPSVRCGLGACFAEVECVDGRAPACVPGAPSAEVCNSVDDDCDGRVDEGLPGSHLSEPVIVRADDEGDTGDCRVCARAFSPNVLPVEDGLLALWQLDFLFTESEPNTFVRRLAADGTPLEPVRLLTERNTTFGMRATPIREGRSLLTFCERFSDGTDHPAAMLIDGAGLELAPIEVFDEEVRCQTGRPPEPVWTGADYLAVWGASHERLVRLEWLDPAGRHRESRDTPFGGVVSAFLPSDGGTLLVVDESVALIDERGELVQRSILADGEVLMLPSPTGFVEYRVRSSGGLDPSLVVAQRGRDRRGVPVDIERAPLPVLDPRFDVLELIGGAPRRGGALLGARLARTELVPGDMRGMDRVVVEEHAELWEIDMDGERVQTFRVEGEKWLDLRFADNGGQTVMIYIVETSDARHNEVRLRTLGCEP